MGALLVCPECAHEWEPAAGAGDETLDGPREIRDAVGTRWYARDRVGPRTVALPGGGEEVLAGHATDVQAGPA